MYCSSCGVAVAQGLSYCNFCGARLAGVKDDRRSKSPDVRPESLIGAMVFTFVFGLVAITAMMGVMKVILGLDVGLILAFALLTFLIMVVVEGVFIRLLLRGRRRAAEDEGALSKRQETKELDASAPRTLPEPLVSVTEHTTRALEHTHSEQTPR